MNTFADNGHNISDTERAALKRALTAYYIGNGRIAEVFAQVEPGLIDRYYRRKKAFPAEMAEIDKERALKQKKQHVTGRCAACRYLDICGGNFRARAEAAAGDMWAPDPACYLDDGEIGVR